MTAALLLAALAATPLSAPACPIDRAVYRLHGAPAFTAGFARQDRRKTYASDLVLWLRTPSRTYWFSFGSPNGYGGTLLEPDVDPRLAARMDDDAEREAAERVSAGAPLAIQFNAFRPDLAAFESPPQSSDPPPALLFARGLGPALWYDWTRTAGGDRSALREAMPIGLFEAAGCAGPPPER